jgi:uncharacterized protein YgiM (DUF1202 family)
MEEWMRSLVKFWLIAGLVSVAVSAFAAGAGTMSVQVKNGQIRATPSFLGKVVAPLSYGDKVQVLETKNEWMNVTGPGGQSGWVHSSALTKKKIVMASGSQDVQTGASGDELALASKGFNSDVEADFKSKNQNVDFTWVDRMEKYKVTPEEMQAFLKEGHVKPSEGGAP